MRSILIHAATAALALVFGLPAFAQSQPHARPKDLTVVDQVPPPPKVKEGQSLLEPVVTTRTENGDTIHEYRIRGKLYQQRVQPAKGPAYYLIDEKGEGKFSRVDGPEVKLSVPMWVVKEW